MKSQKDSSNLYHSKFELYTQLGYIHPHKMKCRPRNLLDKILQSKMKTTHTLQRQASRVLNYAMVRYLII